MTVKVSVEGSEQLAESLAELAELTGLEETLRQAGERVRAEALARLEDGAKPDSDQGRLARSIDVEVDGEGAECSVGTTLAAGRHLEFGTRRMPAYPWLGPALEAALPFINQQIRNLVASAARAAARP